MLFRRREFGELSDFLANCFHQDWNFEFRDDDEAIRWYLEEFPEDVEKARSELGSLLALGLSEDELRQALTDLGCYYSPRRAGLTTAAWVHSVRARLG